MTIIDNRDRPHKMFQDVKQGEVFMYDEKTFLMTDDSDLAVCLDDGEIWKIEPITTIYPIDSVRIVID